jgi:hypothetical protein
VLQRGTTSSCLQRRAHLRSLTTHTLFLSSFNTSWQRANDHTHLGPAGGLILVLWTVLLTRLSSHRGVVD